MNPIHASLRLALSALIATVGALPVLALASCRSAGRAAPAAGPAAAAGTVAPASDPRVMSFLGQTPPEIASSARWLSGSQTSLAALRGRVVFLQFSFPTCPACKRMPPHMVRWDAAYRAEGLSVIYVADGRRVTPEAFRSTLEGEGASFALVHDGAAATTSAYGVRSYPTAYVIGRDGRVVWEGIPHYNPGAVEQAIRGALAGGGGR